MVYYVVIDTNVFVSSLLYSKDDAATVQIVSKMIQGEIIRDTLGLTELILMDAL